MTSWKKASPQPSRSAYSRAVDDLQSLGLTLPPKPKVHPDDNGIPLLPDDLGELSDDELMDIFNRMTQWCNFVATQLVKVEIQEDDIDARLRVMESSYVVANVPVGERGLQRAQRELHTDTEIIAMRDVQLQRRALRKMTATLFANTERSITLISRELSRRIGMAVPQGRLAWQRP